MPRHRSLQARSRPVPAARLHHHIYPVMARSVRQLYVQDGHVRAVLSDGSWLVFMQTELGLDGPALAERSNDGAVQIVVERMLTWKARQTSQASLFEVDLNGTRLVATPAALAYYDVILSRTSGSPGQSAPGD